MKAIRGSFLALFIILALAVIGFIIVYFAIGQVTSDIRITNNTSREIEAVTIYFAAYEGPPVYQTQNINPAEERRGNMRTTRGPRSSSLVLGIQVAGTVSEHLLIGYIYQPFGNIRINIAEDDDNVIALDIRIREPFFGWARSGR
ncbi:MAG: hypothetical protein FWE42_07385 [Defluviitaleaceae bacterium]|nr:hypothetical protein [Defluviitaleaceae bacterium]